MANFTEGHGCLIATAATNDWTSAVWIKGIYWVGDDAAGKDIADGDQLDLHDASGGNLIISKRAGSAEDGLEITLPQEDWIKVKGLYVTTMGGGILIIKI